MGFALGRVFCRHLVRTWGGAGAGGGLGGEVWEVEGLLTGNRGKVILKRLRTFILKSMVPPTTDTVGGSTNTDRNQTDQGVPLFGKHQQTKTGQFEQRWLLSLSARDKRISTLICQSETDKSDLLFHFFYPCLLSVLVRSLTSCLDTDTLVHGIWKYDSSIVVRGFEKGFSFYVLAIN